MAHEHFANDLIPVSDVMPETHLTDGEIKARIKTINDEFERSRPTRLRVKSYHTGRLSVFVSDAGKPAKRKLVQIRIRSMNKTEMLAVAKSKVEAVTAEFYDADVARCFMEAHGYTLLSEDGFNIRDGFNVLVVAEASQALSLE